MGTYAYTNHSYTSLYVEICVHAMEIRDELRCIHEAFVHICGHEFSFIHPLLIVAPVCLAAFLTLTSREFLE